MAIIVFLTFDFDALSIWIGTFKQMTPMALSRGEFGSRVGVDRILRVLAVHDVKATFFVPGHTALTFPGAVCRIAEAGHEIAAYNDLHETPLGLSRDEEWEIMERAETALVQVVGVRAIGYRSPAWELSPNTIALLVEHGYRYDSSLKADDFRPYRPRQSDAVEADGEVCFGSEALLWEFPVAWELDDYPYSHFAHRPLNQGPRSPREVEVIWLAEFEYCRAHVDHGVFTLTTHPEIIGRGSRIAMLERLIGAMKEAGGIKFLTMSAAAAELDKRERYQTGVPQLRDRT